MSSCTCWRTIVEWHIKQWFPDSSMTTIRALLFPDAAPGHALQACGGTVLDDFQPESASRSGAHGTNFAGLVLGNARCETCRILLSFTAT